MFFWNKVCGLFTVFFIFTTCLRAQNQASIAFSNNHFIVKNKRILHDSISCVPRFTLNNPINLSTIPPDFSTCNYGFFCKEELKIEKATKLPIRIRLGSLQQCNYYEGKGY
jgi:hypothetical protein